MDAVIDAVISHLHYAGVFVLLILGGVGFPFPEDLVLLTSGYLLSSGTFEPVPALAAIYPGVITADFALYALGRKLGPKVVRHPWLAKRIDAEKLGRFEREFRKKGVLLLVFGRHVAGLRAELLLLAGVFRIPFARFALVDSLNAMVTISVMLAIGYQMGESLKAIRENYRSYEHIFIVVLIVALVAYLSYRQIRRRWGKG